MKELKYNDIAIVSGGSLSPLKYSAEICAHHADSADTCAPFTYADPKYTPPSCTKFNQDVGSSVADCSNQPGNTSCYSQNAKCGIS